MRNIPSMRRSAIVLLFWCFAALAAFSSQSQGQSPSAEQVRDLGADALEILKKRCGDCHGSHLEKPKKRFGIVDKIAELRATPRFVNLKEPLESLLFTKTLGPDADMPRNKQNEFEPLVQGEQDTLRAWALAKFPLPGEVKPSSAPAAATPPPFVDEEEWLQAIVEDLNTLSPADQKQARYFTFWHLYNAGASEERLSIERRGLIKLLNSLSWNPKLALPKFFGKGSAIARILLRELSWHESKWKSILAVEKNYFVLHGLDQEERIQKLTTSPMAYVRADWFVFHAAQPPLYHDLLAPMENSTALDSADAIERFLGIDAAANIAAGRAKRAGFRGGRSADDSRSGVSDHNRLIERHEILKYPGAYWKSYDFAGNNGEKSIFDRPFGPASLPHLTQEQKERAFIQDGGELIWSLPNGMQAYLLVDAKGKRINEGPSDIVKDHLESAGKGSVILNGISCISCHSRGMQVKTDTVREAVESLSQPRGTAFTRGEAKVIRDLHPTAEEFKKTLAADSDRFLKASRDLGVEVTDSRGREVVHAVYQDFQNEVVGIAQAASELGLTPAALSKQLGSGPISTIGLALEGRGITRDHFLDAYGQIARAIRLRPLADSSPRKPTVRILAWADTLEAEPDPKIVTDPAVLQRILESGLPWRVRDKGTGIEFLLVPAGSYRRGASPGDANAEGDENPAHTVVITSPFYLGRYEVTNGQYRKHDAAHSSGSFKSVNLDGEAQPVVMVSHEEAEAFCAKYGLRLPTEAEWEFAARAGATTRYPWGEDPDGGRGFANVLGPASKAKFGFFGDSFSFDDGHDVTAPVGTFAPSRWGFSDLIGNAWEWCADWYSDGEYKSLGSKEARDPKGPSAGSARVLRGGSWNYNPLYCRVSDRDRFGPSFRFENVGFRAARTP
ncbi:MAG: formylglycine-generating enzyme family protein [Planctomycetes bacterium]|nr:formylglycine-generating enzyme family protein [Planctomycetota bacterium]